MTLTTRRPSRSEEARTRILKEVTEAGGKMRRLNVELDQSLYRQIKRQAVEDDRTISEITRELWIVYLSKSSDE